MVAAAAICAVLALVIPLGWLSLLLLAPLAFFLTGYAIAAAAFVEAPAPPARLAAISVALSLAVLALLPLPLNYLGGLTPATWALALVLVVARRLRRRRARRPAAGATGGVALAAAPDAPAALARLSASAPWSLVAAALVLAYVPLSNSEAVGFTELWMRPVADARRRRGADRGRQRGAEGDRLPAPGPLRRRRRPGRPQDPARPGESSVLQLLASPQPTAGRPTLVAAALYRRRRTETALPPRLRLDPGHHRTMSAAPGRVPVEIVIDNYEYADYLAAAIDSALAQTHPATRVIVVDATPLWIPWSPGGSSIAKLAATSNGPSASSSHFGSPSGGASAQRTTNPDTRSGRSVRTDARAADRPGVVWPANLAATSTTGYR